MKRSAWVVTLWMIPLVSLAEDQLGKADPMTGPVSSSPVGIMPIMQMALALAFVLVLVKYVLPKVVGKLNKRISPALGGAINIEESAAFAGGNLYVVTVRNKTLLLSASSTGVNCLADLTENPFEEALRAAEEDKPEPKSRVEIEDIQDIEEPAYLRAMRTQLQVVAHNAIFSGAESELHTTLPNPEPVSAPLNETTPDNDEAQQALARLRRLMG